MRANELKRAHARFIANACIYDLCTRICARIFMKFKTYAVQSKLVFFCCWWYCCWCYCYWSQKPTFKVSLKLGLWSLLLLLIPETYNLISVKIRLVTAEVLLTLISVGGVKSILSYLGWAWGWVAVVTINIY